MTTVLPTLTDDERTVLMITARGEMIADIGEYSRWSKPIQSLVKRGLLKQHDKFNNSITAAGREALEAAEQEIDGELKVAMEKFAADMENSGETRAAVNRLAEPARGIRDAAPYGASVVNGKLFFKLLDGSTVTCECIGEPYASKIVEACRASSR